MRGEGSSHLRVERILAPNAGLYELEGTNTYLVGGPPSIVIDPGPDHTDHIEKVLRRALGVAAILVTHGHPDHAPGATRLAQLSGVLVSAKNPPADGRPLRDGELITTAGATLEVIETPGHTRDHLAYWEARHGALFTGDAVLGRGTSVIDPPDGDVAAYLNSLATMLDLEPTTIYPGHGPIVHNGVERIRAYIEHRRRRERQLLAELRHGQRSLQQLVVAIYHSSPPETQEIAARSVLAHLIKLELENRVARVSIGNAASAGTRETEDFLAVWTLTNPTQT